jgi:hypothetical protein
MLSEGRREIRIFIGMTMELRVRALHRQPRYPVLARIGPEALRPHLTMGLPLCSVMTLTVPYLRNQLSSHKDMALHSPIVGKIPTQLRCYSRS